jgi:hypothetical protein
MHRPGDDGILFLSNKGTSPQKETQTQSFFFAKPKQTNSFKITYFDPNLHSSHFQNSDTAAGTYSLPDFWSICGHRL